MASGGSAIRGSRVGAGPMGEQDHGVHADRVAVSYWDALGNHTRRFFSATLPADEIPETIDSPQSGLPAGRAGLTVRHGAGSPELAPAATRDGLGAHGPALRERASVRSAARGDHTSKPATLAAGRKYNVAQRHAEHGDGRYSSPNVAQ